MTFHKGIVGLTVENESIASTQNIYSLRLKKYNSSKMSYF